MREVHELVGLLQQHGTLGLGLRNVETASVDCDFGFRSLLDYSYTVISSGPCHLPHFVVPIQETGLTLGFPAKDHALDDPTSAQSTSHDLDHPDRIDIEVFRVLRHHCERGLGGKSGQESFRARLLRCQRRGNSSC